MFSEEDSVPLTHCKGDKRWDTSELMLQLTTPRATEFSCLAVLHMNRTRAHVLTHSALAVRGQGPCHSWLPQACSGQPPSHLHTPTDRGGWGAWHQKAFSHTYTNTALIFMYTQNTHPDTQHACLLCHVMSCMSVVSCHACLLCHVMHVCCVMSCHACLLCHVMSCM